MNLHNIRDKLARYSYTNKILKIVDKLSQLVFLYATKHDFIEDVCIHSSKDIENDLTFQYYRAFELKERQLCQINTHPDYFYIRNCMDQLMFSKLNKNKMLTKLNFEHINQIYKRLNNVNNKG